MNETLKGLALAACAAPSRLSHPQIRLLGQALVGADASLAKMPESYQEDQEKLQLLMEVIRELEEAFKAEYSPADDEGQALYIAGIADFFGCSKSDAHRKIIGVAQKFTEVLTLSKVLSQ